MANSHEIKWSGKSRGGSFGYRFFITLIRTAGIRFSYFFLSFVVVYFVPAAPRATRAIWNYYRRILGRGRISSAGSVVKHYYRFGQTLIDKIAIGSGMRDRFKFEFDNYQRFLEILDGEQGVVMIGAHIGNWEAGAVFFGDYASKMNIVLYDSEYEKIKEALRSGGSDPGFKVIAVNEDGLDNILKITKALSEGEYVCFQGDRYLRSEKTLCGEFLGREARFPMGPFLTASRLKVPVIYFYSMRESGRRYRFIFREARFDSSRSTVKPEQSLLEDYLRSTEEIVRRYPEQWFNFYNFWN